MDRSSKKVNVSGGVKISSRIAKAKDIDLTSYYPRIGY
jgi:hypothetical protein